MLSLKHLNYLSKQVPECFFNGFVARNLTHFASSQSNAGGNGDNKGSQTNPNVSSYYKVNNQSAIDSAACKVSILFLIIVPNFLNDLKYFCLALSEIDSLHDPVFWEKS